jgi:hypothetical protein
MEGDVTVVVGERPDCEKCKERVNGIEYLECYVCNAVLHTHCTILSKSIVRSVFTLKNLKFVCDNCLECGSIHKRKQIDDTEQLIDDDKKLMKSLLDEMREVRGLKGMILDMKSELEQNVKSEVNKQLANMQQISNSEFQRQNSTKKRRKISEEKFVQSDDTVFRDKKTFADVVKKTPVLKIIPKNATQKNFETRNELSKIDPVEMEIKEFRNVENGGIELKCSNEKATDLLKKKIMEDYGEKYEIVESKMTKPKIKIVGLDAMLDNEKLVTKILRQNDDMDIRELTVIKQFTIEKWSYKNVCAIVEVDALSFDSIMNMGFLRIGFERCKVFEFVSILRCYKCCKYGHKSMDCKSEVQVCAKCANNHSIKDCDSDVLKCVNCDNSNKDLKLSLDTNHIAYSVNCPIYKNKLEQKRNRVDYFL